jgi:hypothetical protein
MRWAGHVARMGEKRKVYKMFVGKPEGKKPSQILLCKEDVFNVFRPLTHVDRLLFN